MKLYQRSRRSSLRTPLARTARGAYVLLPMDSDAQKQAAGRTAADLVEPGMVVGLGTGSTAAHFVRALAERKLDIVGVATSAATAALAQSLGFALKALDDVDAVDLTVDGADEIG